MKKVLVTGGAGFLGSHLCDRLILAGCEVLCLDNFTTGRMSNIRHLIGNSRFSVLTHDVVNPIDIQVDEIFNLACPASPVHYQRDSLQTIKTSVLGALNLLELARKRGARIFQASTSEVYGDPDVHPQPESYWGRVNPIGPRSCYDEGKRCAETLFFDFQRAYGIDVKVVRIFNTYGPRMDSEDGRVVSNFIVQALRGDQITIYGDGRQTRSFCYVDDLIDAFLLVMNSPRGFIGPVNLGNPVEFTVAELAEKVIELVGSKSRLVCMPLPVDDPRQRRPEIELARRQLGWEPKVGLGEGLHRTIAYFRQALITQ